MHCFAHCEWLKWQVQYHGGCCTGVLSKLSMLLHAENFILILFYYSLKPINVSDAYKVGEICKLYCLQSNWAINATTCMKPSFVCTLHSARTAQTQCNHKCNRTHWTQHNPMQPNSLQHKASQKDPTHSRAQHKSHNTHQHATHHNTQHNQARHHSTPHRSTHTHTDALPCTIRWTFWCSSSSLCETDFLRLFACVCVYWHARYNRQNWMEERLVFAHVRHTGSVTFSWGRMVEGVYLANYELNHPHEPFITAGRTGEDLEGLRVNEGRDPIGHHDPCASMLCFSAAPPFLLILYISIFYLIFMWQKTLAAQKNECFDFCILLLGPLNV